MTVHYLLKSDFCFTFPIKFKFKDFALHLPCNFVEAKYAPLHTLLSSTVAILISFPACRGHFRPQRPRSFWSAPRIATSGRVRIPEHAQRFHFVLSANQICQTWLWACAEWHEVRDSRISGVGLSQRSLFLVPTKRSAPSGDDNVWRPKSIINWSVCNGYVTRLERSKKTHILALPTAYLLHLLL